MRSHEVFTEYGNVDTKFSYITREGFGWTNASCQVGLMKLPQKLRKKLNQMILPEWIFEKLESILATRLSLSSLFFITTFPILTPATGAEKMRRVNEF